MPEQSLEQSERLAREAALNREGKRAEVSRQPQEERPSTPVDNEGHVSVTPEAASELPLMHDEVHPDLPLPVEIPEKLRGKKLEEIISSGVEIEPNRKGVHAHEAMEDVIRKLGEKG